MIIEVTIPQEIVHNLTVEEVVEMNMTGLPVPGGGGEGDMTKDIYNPHNIAADAFDMDSMAEGQDNKLVSQDEKDAWNSKADGNHNHDGTYEPANSNIQAHIAAAHAPLQAFPVGSVFTSVVGTNPGTLLGYGTWEAFGAGKVLIGINPADTDFDTVEETGGAKTVQSSPQSFQGNTLATHKHAGISAGKPGGTLDAADRTIEVSSGIGSKVADRQHGHVFTGNDLPAHQHAATSAGTPAGTNTPGIATSVVQPYIVVYFWKRTA